MAIIPITDKVLFWDPTNPINKIAMANANNSDTAYTMQDIINTVSYSGGSIDGSGTANYVSKFIDTNTIGNSLITDNGTTVTITSGTLDLPNLTVSGVQGTEGQVLTAKVGKSGGYVAWETNLEPYLPLTGGTISGALTLQNKLIDGDGATGTAGQVLTSEPAFPGKVKWADAATGAGVFLPLAGGTMTGALVVDSTATVNNILTAGLGLALTGGAVGSAKLVLASTNKVHLSGGTAGLVLQDSAATKTLTIDGTGTTNDGKFVVTVGATQIGLSVDPNSGVFLIGDTDELGDGVYATNTGTSSFDIFSGGSVKFSMNTAGNVTLSVGKAFTVSTVAGDIATTLTTKDYVDANAGASNVTNTTSGVQITSPGSQNTFIGFEAGNLNSSNENTYIGYQAGEVSTGSDNTFIGNEAGEGATTGSRNVAVGHEAGEGLFTGGNNVLIGWNAGSGVSSSENTCVGYNSGGSNSSLSTNIGTLAGNGGGVQNVSVGWRAGYSGGDTGLVAIGYESAYEAGGALAVTAVGWKALRSYNLEDDSYVTGIGYEAGYSATEGANGTFVGHRAGYLVNTGANNTMLGSFAGDAITTGSNNILIGYAATASAATVSNEITLGNSSVTVIRAAVTSITSLSDERDKKDIKDITYGVEFINKLKPREFVWDNRPEARTYSPSKTAEKEVEIINRNKGKKDFGFIAQEVQVHDDDTLRLIYDANPEKLEMSYGKLVPILVQAIQDLSAKVTALENK